jgi:hypothetical protein
MLGRFGPRVHILGTSRDSFFFNRTEVIVPSVSVQPPGQLYRILGDLV